MGGVIALLLPFTGYTGYHLYLSQQKANATYQYLATPIGTNDKGEAITRADVLAAIAQRVADAPDSAPKAPVPADGRTP